MHCCITTKKEQRKADVPYAIRLTDTFRNLLSDKMHKYTYMCMFYLLSNSTCASAIFGWKYLLCLFHNFCVCLVRTVLAVQWAMFVLRWIHKEMARLHACDTFVVILGCLIENITFVNYVGVCLCVCVSARVCVWLINDLHNSLLMM